MRRAGSLISAVLAAALIAPASAAALASASPSTLNFGSVPVGATSAPQSVTLTQFCTLFDSTVTPLCLTSGTDVFTLAPSASGDFAASSGSVSPCSTVLDPVVTSSVSCVVDVRFTPTVTGTRTGTLSTGTLVLPPGPGPTVALSGVGTTPDPAGGGGTPTGTGTPTGSTATKKKCKKAKKRAAQTAKKCKKKR